MLFSTGYEQQVFHFYFGQNANISHELDQTNLIKAKSLDVRYNLVVRFKNSKKTSECNNESLQLQFDQDLSPDFTRSHVDFKTGKSLTLSLIAADQPYYGNTALTLHAVYTNEQQELLTNRITFYCKTLPGTIEKRLQHYRRAFEHECNGLMAEYFEQGFAVQEEHIISNMASFLHFARDGNGKSYLSEIVPVASINQLLTIFSVLNDDCFHKDQRVPPWTDLYTYPFNGRKDHRHTKANIPADQEAELLTIAELLARNKKTLSELFDECHRSPRASAGRFDYAMFKETFLNLRLQ
ncbi:hypothetical protein AWB71_05300 [Caballeronia peredens]|nr:hypothetical protein AWB71_05300 [Caballeronia peredens]